MRQPLSLLFCCTAIALAGCSTSDDARQTDTAVHATADTTPLEDMIELVTLVYDGKTDGAPNGTHVIVRYKSTAHAEPPDWWVAQHGKREILQVVWVDDDEHAQRSSKLWLKHGDIRLVRVTPDATSACFIREPGPGGEGAPAIKEEVLLKTPLRLSQAVLAELRRMQQ